MKRKLFLLLISIVVALLLVPITVSADPYVETYIWHDLDWWGYAGGVTYISTAIKFKLDTAFYVYNTQTERWQDETSVGRWLTWESGVYDDDYAKYTVEARGCAYLTATRSICESSSYTR